ncbi:MAG: hypothetical protein OEY64_11745 [Nitrospinota bacterium]|nr:hypothetical protein [Nitrospinota bacterium]
MLKKIGIVIALTALYFPLTMLEESFASSVMGRERNLQDHIGLFVCLFIPAIVIAFDLDRKKE